MELNYILDIDSSERDPQQFPNPNDYVIKPNRRMYNVTNIKLISARIPTTQLLINEGNKQFDITTDSNNTIVLQEGTWSNGFNLASNLQDQLVNFDGLSNNLNVNYESNTQSFTFTNSNTTSFSFNFYGGSNGYATSTSVGTPAEVLGFSHSNISSTGNVLVSNIIDLNGPNSIIIALSSGSSNFHKQLYIDGAEFSIGSNSYDSPVSQPLATCYTGRILTEGLGQIIDYSGRDDPIDYRFYKGPEKSISKLRVQFYYNNGTKLIPYDFGNRNHILKFEITCSLDKFVDLPKNVKPTALPPPIEFKHKKRLTVKQKQTLIVILIALFGGLVMLSMFKRPVII
jgi:hypothetical protein